MDSKRFLLIVWWKMGVEIVELSGPVASYSFFLTCPIKMISQQNFCISSGVILNQFSVLGETCHFYAFLQW
jgi:hypothetical protein